MFCPKCGSENPDGSKFCGVCGASFAPAPAPAPGPVPGQQSYAPYGGAPVPPAPSAVPTNLYGASRGLALPIVIAVVAVVVGTLSMLMPWVDIKLGSIPNAASDFYEVGMSPTLSFTLASATSIIGLIADLLGASIKAATGQGYSSNLYMVQEVSDGLGMARIVTTVIWVLWIASIVLVAIAVYDTVSSKGSSTKLLGPAGITCAVDALAWVIVMGSLDGTVRDALTSTGTATSSAVIAASPFVWVTLVCGIVAIVVAILHKQGILR